MNHQRKTVSLWFELLHLIEALDGVRSLLDALTSDGFDSAKDARRLPVAAMSINNLVLLRMHALCDVVRHNLDPATFWAPHNDAGPVGLLGDEHDIRFEEWQQNTAKTSATPKRRRKKRSKMP